MKFDVTLHAGTESSQHQIELLPGASSGTGTGQAEFRLDGDRGEPQLADWAEVSPGVYSILLGGRSYETRIAPRSDARPPAEPLGPRGRPPFSTLSGGTDNSGPPAAGLLVGRVDELAHLIAEGRRPPSPPVVFPNVPEMQENG